MASTFTMAPGVFFNWIDAGVSPTAIATSIGGGAFHADRGSLTPTSQTSGYDGFQKTYGVSNYTRSYGHDTFRAFFRTGQAAVTVRSPGQNAVYASSLVANNYVYNTAGTALVYEGASVTPLGGSTVDYTQIDQDAWDVIFSGEMPTSASVTLTINGVTTAAVVSQGDQIAFMAQLQAAVNTALTAIATSASVSAIGAMAAVVSRVTSTPVNPSNPATTPRILRIVSPQNITLDVTAVTLTGAAPVIAVAQPTEWLAYAVAQNPGAWGSNNAMQFTQLNLGTVSSVQLLMSGVSSPLNSFSAVINGVNITVPAIGIGAGTELIPTDATWSNDLLASIAATITANVPNVTATVPNASGTNNNRRIVLTASNSSFTINVGSAVLLKNAATLNTPVFNISTLTSAFVPSTDFVLNIYEYPNLQTVVGSYAATFAETVDATGNPTNLAMQINSGASGAPQSNNIRLYMNPLVASEGLSLQSSTLLNFYTGDGFMGGGVNGVLSTSADIINAWNQLSDPTQWTVRILMNCGHATIPVQQAMDQLCQSRRDCIAILDLAPQSQTDDVSTIAYRNSMNINSSYSTLYTPNIQIYDLDYNIYRSSPPSGYVGAVYALTDQLRHEWWSPAGLTRGNIPEAEGLDVAYSQPMISNMYGSQVNPIINYKNESIVVFGDWTLYQATSPLQYVGTRRMCNTIEITASMTVAYSLFEPNTQSTRNRVVLVSTQILQAIQDASGINRFEIVDLTQSYHIDNRQAYFRYIIDPVTSIHQIIIDGIITQSNASFAEYTVISANNNSPGSSQAAA